MTFPCKENLIFFEATAKRQKRIYPDACDHGYLIEYPSQKDTIREELQALVDFYGCKSSRWGHPSVSHGSTTMVCIPVEPDEGKYSCIILKVSHNYDRSHKKEFFSIEFERTLCSQSEAVNTFNCKVFK